MQMISSIHEQLASTTIKDFAVDPDKYDQLPSDKLSIKGEGLLYAKSDISHLYLTVDFGKTAGCKVFLGQNVQGRVQVNFMSNNSIAWIGNNTKLNGLGISCYQENDFVAVGNSTSVNSSCIIISGRGSQLPSSSIIIGDDCMFSNNIVIRNTDAHPIISRKTCVAVNEPIKPVVIEPHVWIGERVSIMKNVTIGACSIIGTGSVVTKDVPRFSVAGGSPVKVIRVDRDTIWSRDNSKVAIQKALAYAKAFEDDE